MHMGKTANIFDMAKIVKRAYKYRFYPTSEQAARAGQVVVPDHVLYAQVLDHDRLVVADEPGRERDGSCGPCWRTSASGTGATW